MSLGDRKQSKRSLLLRELEEQLSQGEENGEVLRDICHQLSRIADSLERIARSEADDMKPTYTVKEAAQLLGKSPSTIRRWIREGKLESSKSADNQQGQHFIPASSIYKYL